MRLSRYLLAASLLGAACGDDEGQKTCTGSGDPEELRGSYCEGSEISWDTIELGWFEAAQTIRVRYGFDEGNRVSPRLDIQVLGSMVRLEAGVQIPLRQAAFVRRWPDGASDPQDLTSRLEASSNIVFERLQLTVGGEIRGTFDILLDNGRTLRGRFEGALKDLSAPDGG